MATHLQKHVTGIPVISLAAETENSLNWIVTIQNDSYRQSDHFNFHLVNTPDRFKQSNAGIAGLVTKRMSRSARKADVLASVREQVRLSPKLTEAVRGKLSLGARILQVEGMEMVFKHLFDVSEKEILIKASECYLSTTAGPLAGLSLSPQKRLPSAAINQKNYAFQREILFESNTRLQSHFKK